MKENLAKDLKDMYQQIAGLERRVDRFAYNNGLQDSVGKPVANAINLLSDAKMQIKEAAMEQAIQTID